MCDKSEGQCAAVALRQEKLLGSLTSGRKVFLYTPELGILSRIVEGSSTSAIKAVAPFFRPWLFGRSPSHAMGDIGVEVPLVDLLLGGMKDRILESLKHVPCARLAGLPWPNGVLNCLVEGRMTDATQYLDAVELRTSRTSMQWLQAACYWSTFPGKERKVMEALEKADPSDPDTAVGWYHLLNDHTSAAKLMQQGVSVPPDSEWRIRVRYLKRADFWGRVCGHEPSTNACLKLAEQQGASDGAISPFLCAMAWAGLLGEKERASHLAETAMRAESAFGLAGALWWRCFRGDPERARECLMTRGIWPDTVGATLTRIEQMMICDASPDEAEAMLQGIRWELVAPVDVNRHMCRAARHWWFLFGNVEKSKLLLSRAIAMAEETCDFLPIAETYLDLSYLSAAARVQACREILGHAGSKAANPLDYVFCAQDWVRLAGDDDRASELLTKAEVQATDPEDMSVVGDAWLELIERGDAGKSIRRIAGAENRFVVGQ